jgi:hypothetical protein
VEQNAWVLDIVKRLLTEAPNLFFVAAIYVEEPSTTVGELYVARAPLTTN